MAMVLILLDRVALEYGIEILAKSFPASLAVRKFQPALPILMPTISWAILQRIKSPSSLPIPFLVFVLPCPILFLIHRLSHLLTLIFTLNLFHYVKKYTFEAFNGQKIFGS